MVSRICFNMADSAEDGRGTEREGERERRERCTLSVSVCGFKWAYLRDTSPAPDALPRKGRGYGRHGNCGRRLAPLSGVCGYSGRGSQVGVAVARKRCSRGRKNFRERVALAWHWWRFDGGGHLYSDTIYTNDYLW